MISAGRPSCRVIFGVNSYSAPVPAALEVLVEKNLTAGTSIVVYFTKLQNPAAANYRFKVGGFVMTDCSEKDMQKMCPGYRVYKHYTLAATSTASLTTAGSHSSSPSTVYLTATQTFSDTYSSAASSLVRVTFDSNVAIPACSTTDPCVTIP